MMIDNEYELGDIVYLKTDEEQSQRIVTCIHITPNNLQYRLACGSSDSYHYCFEITPEKSYLLNDMGAKEGKE